MEFRLTYEGLLLGASRNNTRASHKHEIRRVLHHQLIGRCIRTLALLGNRAEGPVEFCPKRSFAIILRMNTRAFATILCRW
jgi:hypothetical protein